MKTKILMLANILLVLFLAGCSGGAVPVSAQAATATTAVSTQVPSSNATAQSTQSIEARPVVCAKPAALTPAVTEGPYFKANSPERSSLLDVGVTGTKLTLTGYVLTANCQPVAHALLDFWQANAQGQYDNSGYTLRGHQYTDANGYYHLETIVPGLYPGRTEHIHVKVEAQGGSILTTQLFFPGTSENQSDSIYDKKLLMGMKSTAAGEQGSYNFIIAGSGSSY